MLVFGLTGRPCFVGSLRVRKNMQFALTDIRVCKENSRPLPGSDLSEDKIGTSWKSCLISFLVLTKATMGFNEH